jgi:hypothetical protein
MAYHIKARFADLCGIQRNKLAVYIKRGKVVCSGDVIDDSHPVNREFIEKWQHKSGLVEEKSDAVEVDANTVTGTTDAVSAVANPFVGRIPKIEPPKPRPAPKSPNIQPPSEFMYAGNQLDAQIKSVELERKLEDLEIAKLKRQKMAGESMPTDLVKNTISVYSRSVSRSFNNAADNLLVEFQTMADISREQVSVMRGKLNAIVNKAINDAYENAIDMVDNIVDEYSETRGKGERLS